MKITRWLTSHWQKLLATEDSPRAVALGAAIGIFFGFTPLFGVKTLLAVGIAWLVGGNVAAAIIAVSLHDVLLPLMPVLLRWEYQIGYWILHTPHMLPPPIKLHHRQLALTMRWSSFLTVGRPLLLGSLLISTPAAVLSYFLMHAFLARAQRRNQLKVAEVAAAEVAEPRPPDSPS